MQSKMSKNPSVMLATFMGAKGRLEFSHTPVVEFPNGKKYLVRDLKYKTRWDWLMPACHKFDNIYKSVKMGKRKYKMYEKLCDDIDNAVTLYEIGPAFEALVRGVKWLNENTSKK